MTTHILRIDASARQTGSVTRELNDQVIDHLQAQNPVSVTTRDLTDPIPFIDQEWVAANTTDPSDRTDAQRAKLAQSDALVDELRNADIILIGLPIYNFGVPAALKAWIDQIARARVTFRYSETGPVGLLTGKRAIVTVASGGVAQGAETDFATGYMRHVLGFIGITDVEFVSADRMMVNADSLREAQEQVASLAIAV